MLSSETGTPVHVNNTTGSFATAGNRDVNGRDDECCFHRLGDGTSHNACDAGLGDVDRGHLGG